MDLVDFDCEAADETVTVSHRGCSLFGRGKVLTLAKKNKSERFDTAFPALEYVLKDPSSCATTLLSNGAIR
jgi:hypothetical protein